MRKFTTTGSQYARDKCGKMQAFPVDQEVTVDDEAIDYLRRHGTLPQNRRELLRLLKLEKSKTIRRKAA